ncbi:MAG: FHA domain-containing protein [Planctomycetota bacterium]
MAVHDPGDPQRAALPADVAAAVLAAIRAFHDELAAGTADPAAVTARGFRLLVSRGDEASGQDLRYEVPRVTIGRREGENLLRLNDPMVSSAHAVIECTPEGIVVSDCGSTNGTEVDGVRLPREVAQPLHEGSVIVIKPFRLVFHHLPADGAEVDLSAGALLERLRGAFAAKAESPPRQQQEALVELLRPLRALGDPGSRLDELARLLRPGAGDESLVAVAALRALTQLSRSLLGSGEFTSPEQVQVFAGKLGRFADATSRGMERLLELRKVLGRHLELGLASTASGRPSVRTAAEVRDLLLGWQSGATAADASGWFAARFFDDLVAIVTGLLQGNQQVRRAVRERLDPATLVEVAGREAKLRALVQAAAGSLLWQTFVQAFEEVTGGGGAEDAQLAELLERARADRPAS